MQTAIGNSITAVDTEPKYELGSIFVKPNGDRGDQHWVYVFNDEAATDFGEGNVVMRDAGALTADGILTTDAANPPRVRILGVAQHTIGFGKYGWILKRGVGKVLAGVAGVTADTAIVADGATAGTAEDVAAAQQDMVFGLALTTAAATELADAWIDAGGI